MLIRDRIKFHLVPTSWHLANKRRRHRQREPEFNYLPILVAPDRVALDVGANKGVYSWELLRLAQSVHAFEPNPANIPWLSRLTSSRLTVHPVALGDHDGEAILRIPNGRGGRAAHNQGTLARTKSILNGFTDRKVAVHSLDSLDLGDIGFIKIDVEGFETQVIEGARETISRCRPIMLIEIEELHTGRPPQETIVRIEALGYACYALAGGVLTDAHSVDLSRTPPSNWIFLPSTRPSTRKFR